MSSSKNEEKLISKEVNQITYHNIAAKLLQDRLLLTALELHTELIESGKELRILRDFFSNPGNFESQTQEIPARLSRSASQTTLDSLDFTRYSEEGTSNDERVAVLEFELRKAKETINALRNNLTVATESETSTPDKGSLKNSNVAVIKPHEQRALNFLINEYLLMHGYKLSSITFADENQNQDFDDWDDVGLNISKPPELLALYREGLKQSGQNCIHAFTQTNNNEVENLKEILGEKEKELEEFKSKLYDIEIELSEVKKLNTEIQKENETLSNQTFDTSAGVLNDKILPSGTPEKEKFEIIDKNASVFKRDSDNVSDTSINVSDWTNISISTEKDENSPNEDKIKEISANIAKEDVLTKEIFSICYVNIPQKFANETLNNLFSQEISNDALIHTLSYSLLQVIPNIILNKREEVIPLLISAVYLNPKATERDKLLQQLFNLKKRPAENERLMILTGVVRIAKCAGENLVENEILPQCWLQLAHKYVERRLLVAEACTALIPYVSSPIRNSLILSMLQQMLEDKDEIVRETVIRTLALLFILCNDNDKYQQCEHLAIKTLDDSSNNIANISAQILFPVLGRWSLKTGNLSSSLFKKLLHKLNDCIKDIGSPSKITSTSSDKIQRIVCVIENLLPFLLMSVASNESVVCNIEKDMAVELRSDLVKMCTNLTNPEKFFKSEVNCGMILYEFEKFIGENPNISWPEMDWISDMMLPDLFNNLHHIEISQLPIFQTFLNLFSRICIIFGTNFTRYKILPLLQKKIQDLEQVISSFNQYCPSLNIIPIYLTALSYSGQFEELASILKKFLCALPLCGTPLDCLEVTLKRLCDIGLQDTVVDSLWAGVVHQRPLVKAAAASLFCGIVGLSNEELLKSKVVGAIVTLASDNDILVRTATLPALGALITQCSIKQINDKAYMQLQSYINDSNLTENHTLLRQLIVTLGNIVNCCNPSFKTEVIIPQLTAYAVFMNQMTNQTRKVDLALALLEAFTNVVFSPVNKQIIGSVVKPGLKCLETVIFENQSLTPHQETILSMLKECDSKLDMPASPSHSERSHRISQNVNQGVEEMRQKMSKIFIKPTLPKTNTLPNLQGIFKKK